MPRRAKFSQSKLPANNTVKLPEGLRERVAKAMEVGGFTVWSEFCRVALTQKCLAIESELRRLNPTEFGRNYGKAGSDGRRDGNHHSQRDGA